MKNILQGFLFTFPLLMVFVAVCCENPFALCGWGMATVLAVAWVWGDE